MKLPIVMMGAAIVALSASSVQADELRIGFLNTTSGGGALVGTEMERGWKLGLKHQGWSKNGDRLGGVPTNVYYADDQMRPDVAVAAVKEFLQRDKTQIVSGVIWSNVMMAVQRQIFKAGAMLVSGNAGPTPLAGGMCNPLFVSASFVNDQAAEASGLLVSQEKAKSVVILVPNYQAGKDVAAGFKRTFKGGKITREILYKLGQTDFQADLSRIRALKPTGVFVFAPGSMGIAFVKQWNASGLNREIKLYSMWTVSHLTLPAIGEAAIGSVMADHWNPDLDLPINKRFIKDYIAAYKVHPSHFAMTSYDTVSVIADGVKAVNGKLGDMKMVARAIRQGTFHSVRGDLKFNVNGFPIQPFWKLEVVKGPDGKPLIVGRSKIVQRRDSYYQKCPAKRRI